MCRIMSHNVGGKPFLGGKSSICSVADAPRSKELKSCPTGKDHVHKCAGVLQGSANSAFAGRIICLPKMNVCVTVLHEI